MDGEVFKVLKKIGEKGRSFRIANEREVSFNVNCLLDLQMLRELGKGKGTRISEYARRNNDSFVLFCSVL